MGLFSRFTNRGNSSEPDMEFATMLLTAECDRRGLPWQLGSCEYGPTVELAEGTSMIVAGFVDALRGEPSSRWADLAVERVEAFVQMMNETPMDEWSPDQLRSAIRTRILPVDAFGDERTFNYARPFAPGLHLVLCADMPSAVSTLSDEGLEDLPVPVDELWTCGQANTDAEPIDDSFEQDGVHCLMGESFFIASKAANLVALASRLAPSSVGWVFAIPNRSTLLVSGINSTETAIDAFVRTGQTLVGVLDAGDEANPGGILSPSLYFASPDGRVESVGGPTIEVDGKASFALVPGPLASAALGLEQG